MARSISCSRSCQRARAEILSAMAASWLGTWYCHAAPFACPNECFANIRYSHVLLAGGNLTLVCCELISAMDNVVTTVTWRCHNCAGGLERLYRQSENIADAALGLDHTWRARIDLELAPQSQDLDIDAPIENVLVNTRGLQQVLPRERPLRRLKKGKQQGILTLAQRDRGLVRVNELS